MNTIPTSIDQMRQDPINPAPIILLALFAILSAPGLLIASAAKEPDTLQLEFVFQNKEETIHTYQPGEMVSVKHYNESTSDQLLLETNGKLQQIQSDIILVGETWIPVSEIRSISLPGHYRIPTWKIILKILACLFSTLFLVIFFYYAILGSVCLSNCSPDPKLAGKIMENIHFLALMTAGFFFAFKGRRTKISQNAYLRIVRK